MKKIKIHHLILLSFVLGVFFSIFVGKKAKSIEIKYEFEKKIKSATISNWQNAFFILRNNNLFDTIRFRDYKVLLKKFQTNKEAFVEVSFDSISFRNILDISEKNSIVTYIQPFGTLFLRMLSLLAIPLVIASLIAGVASLGNLKALSRIGFKTITLYIVTTIIAISIGLIVANVISPGKKISNQTRNELFEANKEEIQNRIQQKVEFNLLKFLVEIVPHNPFRAISNGEMLQIIFIALFFGIGLTLVPKDKSEFLVKFFDSVSDVLIALVRIVLYFAPLGVFALIVSTIYDFGFEIISTLFWYVITVLIGYLLHFFIIYPLILFFIANRNPMKFYAGMKDAFLVAFSSSSSAATLPVTFECVEENLKVPKTIAGFVLPLGATMNMDGTSLYQGVATLFIAQVYGIDLNFIQQLIILFTALTASIGTAPVPGVGLIMLIMVLQSVGLPIEGIVLILGVDRILDMMRTVLNVGGDAVVSLCVSRMEENSLKCK